MPHLDRRNHAPKRLERARFVAGMCMSDSTRDDGVRPVHPECPCWIVDHRIRFARQSLPAVVADECQRECRIPNGRGRAGVIRTDARRQRHRPLQIGGRRRQIAEACITQRDAGPSNGRRERPFSPFVDAIHQPRSHQLPREQQHQHAIVRVLRQDLLTARRGDRVEHWLPAVAAAQLEQFFPLRVAARQDPREVRPFMLLRHERIHAQPAPALAPLAARISQPLLSDDPGV